MKLIIIQETNQVINLTTWRIGGDMGVSRDALVPVTIGVDEAPKSLNEHELPKVVKDGGTFVFTWYETLVLGNERWEKKKKKKAELSIRMTMAKRTQKTYAKNDQNAILKTWGQSRCG